MSVQSKIGDELTKVFPRLWRYALTLTGSRQDADDLTQSTCLRAMENVEQFETGTHFDRWAFRITHNIWVSEIRKKKVRQGQGLVSIDILDLSDRDQDPDRKLEKSQLAREVLRLPEAQRQTVVLVYVEGYSYKDVAMILNIPVATVMSRLAAARSTLAKKFRDDKGASYGS